MDIMKINGHWARSVFIILILIVSVVAPVFSSPEIAKAAGGINNTFGDTWGTEEVSASGWLNQSGVPIYSNGPSAPAGPSPATDNYTNNSQGVSTKTGIKWQCVELINRLYISKGWINSRWVGNGGEMYDKAPSHLDKHANGSVESLAVGDVVSMGNGGAGHVAIVNMVNGTSVQVASQNTNHVYDGSFTFKNKTVGFSGWAGFSVTGVIHAPSPVNNVILAGEGGGNAASWEPGRIDTFIRGTDNRMWQKWVDSLGWHGYVQDPQSAQVVTLTSQVAATSWGPNRIDVFARSQTGSLIQRWYDGAGWHPYWVDMGGCIVGEPTVTSWGPNRLDVFAQSCNSTGVNMVHKWYDGTWHDWEVAPNLSVRITSPPSAVSWGPNRIDIFARGEGADLVHNWYNGIWYDIDSQGGCIVGRPAVAAWEPGRLDVFGQTCNETGANVWHKAHYNNAWQPWEATPLDGGVRVTSLLGANSWAPNRLDLFARGTDGTMLQKWYDNAWNSWVSLGGGVAQ